MSDVSHIIESIDRYVQKGIPPGSCTYAILSNDLFGAFGRADDETSAGMKTIVQYVYGKCPANCWGSPERVDAWIKHSGMIGYGKGGAP